MSSGRIYGKVNGVLPIRQTRGVWFPPSPLAALYHPSYNAPPCEAPMPFSIRPTVPPIRSTGGGERRSIFLTQGHTGWLTPTNSLSFAPYSPTFGLLPAMFTAAILAMLGTESLTRATER